MDAPSPFNNFSISGSNRFWLMTPPRIKSPICSAAKGLFWASVAFPGSVSKHRTARWRLRYWARMAATKLLPTPPLACNTTCTEYLWPLVAFVSFDIAFLSACQAIEHRLKRTEHYRHEKQPKLIPAGDV